MLVKEISLKEYFTPIGPTVFHEINYVTRHSESISLFKLFKNN